MSSQYRVLKETNATPLAGAGVYTSSSHFVEQYNHVRGLVKTDQTGTLVIQQSDDNSTWVQTNSIAVTGGTDTKYDEICYSNYVRLKYINGATPQTSFYISINADPFK